MENSDDQFSLKWNNFQSNLATGFHDLLQEEDMVDVTLAAEGKFLQAHKIILSVCSPYFKDLFKVNPCKHPIVILKDVGHQELSDMLDFMYRGEASVRQEDLAAFLKLAETLKVKGLAGDRSGNDDAPSPVPQSKKTPVLIPKKKKVLETTVFDPDDDPGDPDFSPAPGEPKRKRKRLSSPPPKTDNTSASATTNNNNSFVPITNPKQEIQDQDEVEFLDDSQNDPLVQFITGKGPKEEIDSGGNFDDSQVDMTGDDTHDGDMTAGPSNADDSTDQVPQGSKYQDYKYIKSKNGKYLLLYDGFAYRKYMTSKSKQSYWTCTLRGCKAKATMSANGWFSLTKYIHNHEPSQEEMDRKVIMAELRKLSLETDLTVHEMMLQLGISEDQDKKYREAINFWRWRAKRKSEAESAGYYEDSKRIEFDDDYKFVKTDHSHFLQHKNYLYRKYMTSKTDSGSYWRCRRDDCPSRAKLDSLARLTCTNFNHNHAEEEFEGEDLDHDIRQQLRETALTTEFSIPEILKMYDVEEDLELKRYLKNIRCKKSKLQKKRRPYENVINQLGVLESVPPGVFVKIPKDLLCEISELGVDGELNYQEGTLVKVDDESLVQVVNLESDAELDTLEGAMLFKSVQEVEDEEQVIDEYVEEEQVEDELEEVQYETVTLSDYTTLVISSERDEDDKDGISHIIG